MLKKESDLRIFGLANVSAKGQIVIPVNARKVLGLQPGDEIVIFGSESYKFLGAMAEENFRTALTLLQKHVDEGLNSASKHQEVFTNILQQLAEQHERTNQKHGKSDNK